MKKLMISAAVSALTAILATTPALAQRDNSGRGNQSDNRGGGERGPGRGDFNRGPENRGPENRGPENRAPQSSGRATAPENASPRNFGIQDRRQPQAQDQQRPQPQERPQTTGRTNLDAAAAARAREAEQRRQADDRRDDRRPDINRDNNRGPDFGRGGNDFRRDNRDNVNANRWRYDPRDARARREAARDLRYFGRNFVSPNRFRVNVYIGPSGYSYRRWTYGQVLPRAYFARNYWISDFAFYGLEYPPPGYAWVRYGPDALLIDEFTGDIVQVVYNIFWW